MFNSPPPQTVPTDNSLSEDLRRLDELHAQGRPVSVDELVQTLGDRGHAVIVLFFSAPFLLIPVPGVSTVIGSVVILTSVALFLNRPVWLPGFVRRREIPADLLHGIVHSTERVLHRLEKTIRPRLYWVTHERAHRLIGVSLFFGAVALSLPIPIPFNNVPPAIGLVVLALGLLERDGVFVLAGHVYTALLWVLMSLGAIWFWDEIVGYLMTVMARFSA